MERWDNGPVRLQLPLHSDDVIIYIMSIVGAFITALERAEGLKSDENLTGR